MKVVVIGAGVAGTAAAWAAKRAGAEVSVVHDRSGASALQSGAADFDPWERTVGAHEVPGLALPRVVAADETELLEALGFVVSPKPCLVATLAGVLRPARARDSAVLDLFELAGARVAVADVTRDEWDAQLIARSLSASPWAKEHGTRFEARALSFDVPDAERHVSSYDFAARFDDAAAAAALAAELGAARAEVDAWLLGPWLGTRPGTAAALRAQARLPLGEALSPPGGVAGARFELARDELLARLAVELRRARVVGVAPRDGGFDVELEEGEAFRAERVVLAIGGVLASGVILDPPRPGHAGGACFHPSLDVPVMMEADGQPIDSVSTLHGVDFASHGIELLERVGIAVSGAAARGVAGLFVAGDAVADRPRTLLRALASGIAAGRAASA